MHTIILIVTKYGYLGIYILLMFGIIGIPIPDETLLAFAGYMVNKGYLHLIPTITTAFLGSITGITISYIIGRTAGLLILKKYGKYIHFTEEKIDKAHNWFEKYGRWTLTFGYYIPGIRHVTALLAGSSKLKFYEFAIFAYAGGILWTLTFILTGYFVGEEWESFIGKVQAHAFVIIGIILLAVLIYFVIMYYQKKNKSNKEIM